MKEISNNLIPDTVMDTAMRESLTLQQCSTIEIKLLHKFFFFQFYCRVYVIMEGEDIVVVSVLE
jgi:hypothetical protein